MLLSKQHLRHHDRLSTIAMPADAVRTVLNTTEPMHCICHIMMRAYLVEHLGHGDERGAVLFLLRGLQLWDIVQPLLGVHAEQVAPHAERFAQRVRHLRRRWKRHSLATCG
jgi:hypothetical protein